MTSWSEGQPHRSLLRSVARIDRVVTAFAAILLLLLPTTPDQALRSLLFTLDSLWSIAPFLLLSVLVAASAKASGLDLVAGERLSGKAVPAVFLGALIGAFSPFCSCGVVPLIAGLLGAGVPLAPVMAFWVASPLMDPEMFLIMLPVLGLPFTLAKTLAALSMGLIAGGATLALTRTGLFDSPLKRKASGCASTCSGGAKPRVEWAFWREARRRQSFAGEARWAGGFLLKWLAFAFLLESLMVAYLPAEAVGEQLQALGAWSLPASVVAGIPAYLNGYAAIPLVDRLMSLGLPAGAGLAFMLAGGVTSIPAAMAVFPLVRLPVFLAYLAFGFMGALAAGATWMAIAG